MVLRYNSESSDDCIFICQSKSEKKRVMSEFKGEYKHYIQQIGFLSDDTIVYAVYMGNKKPKQGWLLNLLVTNGLEMIAQFARYGQPRSIF